MTERKILIICPSMWPEMNFWGETQRMYYLANHLSQKGWRVFTVSPGYIRKNNTEKKEKHYTEFFLGHKIPAGTLQSEKESGLHGAGMKLRELVFTLAGPAVQWFYNEPNCYEGISKQLWMLRYQKAVFELIKKEDIRSVLVSIPAFVLMKFGPDIKKRFPQVRVIYDYRDPWFLWNKKKGPARRREKKYLSYADKVIGFSRIFSTDLALAMDIGPKKSQPCTTAIQKKTGQHLKERGQAPQPRADTNSGSATSETFLYRIRKTISAIPPT